MKKIKLLLFLLVLLSCNSPSEEVEENNEFEEVIDDTENQLEFEQEVLEDKKEATDFYIFSRIPDWFFETEDWKNPKFINIYEIDARLNPFYLEEDFNGDGERDISFPIKEKSSGKLGFVIFHGKKKEFYILGAGTNYKNGQSDDIDYIDIWKINRNKKNEPGLDENGEIDKTGPLLNENPSVQVEKSEVGGGLFYWNGKEYEYFHQTC